MRIVSWNINGIRSIANKGFKQWFLLHSPDIIALQEIKAQESDVLNLLDDWKAHYKIILHPAAKKGYSGTAFLVKNEMLDHVISINLGMKDHHEENEGRLIWMESKDFILINGYFPNGKHDHSRVDYKLKFSRDVLSFANKFKEKKKGIIICGDVNTAHNEIDLSNPKANIKTTGFLPHERVFIDEMLNDGYVDALRHLYPQEKNIYSWWTYRGNCRERNIGWRLDYFFVCHLMANKIKKITHHKDVLGSDHCPVEIEF